MYHYIRHSIIYRIRRTLKTALKLLFCPKKCKNKIIRVLFNTFTGLIEQITMAYSSNKFKKCSSQIRKFTCIYIYIYKAHIYIYTHKYVCRSPVTINRQLKLRSFCMPWHYMRVYEKIKMASPKQTSSTLSHYRIVNGIQYIRSTIGLLTQLCVFHTCNAFLFQTPTTKQNNGMQLALHTFFEKQQLVKVVFGIFAECEQGISFCHNRCDIVTVWLWSFGFIHSFSGINIGKTVNTMNLHLIGQAVRARCTIFKNLSAQAQQNTQYVGPFANL